MTKLVKNLAASVRQRLLERSRQENRPFQELLQYYAMERFLYRLSRSPSQADTFILKGALLLRAWRAPESRPTMDIDMLGETSNSEANIIAQIQEILSVAVDPDGMNYVTESIRVEMITEDADYAGLRVRFHALLDAARITLQIDIGFGDIVFPGAEKMALPTLLDFPAPILRCYSRESAIAEKFEAMIKLRELNSRMKDFYDIWLLSRQFAFSGADLTEAIKLTFTQRDTELPTEIVAFSKEFARSKQKQWSAFRSRLRQDHHPNEFVEIVSEIEKFLSAPVAAILQGATPPDRWDPSGPWIRR